MATSLRTNVLSIVAVFLFLLLAASSASGSLTAGSGAAGGAGISLSPLAPYAQSSAGSKTPAIASDISCISNGFFSVSVDDSTGLFTFSIGSCAEAGNVVDRIMYALGTSFVTVADFTDGKVYTEAGYGGGLNLGTPLNSTSGGRSVVSSFPVTPDGLKVTQNITIIGTTYSDSAILMNVGVVNTNASVQEVGVRYLWDAQVGGYDGTWLQEYDGTTPGVITGYETNFDPPPSTFTSYAMGGCAQGVVVPPPDICDPSDFGAGAGSFSVIGSISAGPGATAPARFVYGWWTAMHITAYTYVSNPSNEVGSYEPNVGGTQDSAMLYYFSNQTLQAGGAQSDQADITNFPGGVPIFSALVSVAPYWGAVGTTVNVTGTRLPPLSTLALISFGDHGKVSLNGDCTANAVGNITSAAGCTFVVPSSASVGSYTLTFSYAAGGNATASFIVTPQGVAVTFLSVSCAPSSVTVGATTVCQASVVGDNLALPTGSIAWSENGLGEFSGATCTLSRRGVSSTCSIKFEPSAAGSSVTITASYDGDSKNSPSMGTFPLTVSATGSNMAVTCTPSNIQAAGLGTAVCTARVSGYLPSGVVVWSQSGVGVVSFVDRTCALSKVTYYYITTTGGLLVLHKAQVGICSVSLVGIRGGFVAVLADYGGDSGNNPSSAATSLTVRKGSTEVAIECPSASLSKGEEETCTAWVTGGYAPTGTLTWSEVSGSGRVTFSSTTCTLSSQGGCSVIVTAVTPGGAKIEASYGGDRSNFKSSTTTIITVLS